MTGGRIFSRQELEQLGARTSDLIDGAIDAGAPERAKKLNHRMNIEFLEMHDMYLKWVTALLGHIYRRYGDDALYQALSESLGPSWKPVVENYTGKDARSKAEMYAWGLRGHLQPLKVVEDDEKITLMMQPCGSGGKLMLSKSYEPPLNLAKIKKAQHMTFNREDFPVYCAHCAFQEILSIEWAGEPVVVLEPGQEIGAQVCRFHIYKDPKNVPAEFYERFGKKKK